MATSVNSSAHAAAAAAAARARRQAEEARRAAKRAQEAAQKKASEAAQKAANQATNHALKLEQKSNALSVAAGQKPKFKAAEGVSDVYDAASLSKTQQKKLFGTTINSVSPTQAARYDAKKVAAAAAESPEQGAKMLREQMEQSGASSEYKKALARATVGSVRTIGAALNEDTSEDATAAVMEDLSTASELAGKTGAQAIAKSFASDLDWENLPSSFQDGLKSAIEGGAGARFGVELARAADASGAEIQASGGPGSRLPPGMVDAGDSLNIAVTDGVKALRESFEDVKEEADQLDRKLGQLVAGYGPGMSADQRQDAIDAFKARHEDVYGELERLGGDLGQTLAGMGDVVQNGAGYEGLEEEAKNALHLVPDISRSEAGREAISAAVDAKAKGEDSFIDSMGSVAQSFGAEKKFLDGVNHALTTAAADRVLALSADGDVAGARRVIASVASAPTFSAEDRAGLQQAGSDLGKLFSDDPEVRAGALSSLETSLEGSDGRKPLFEDQNGAAATMVRSLGVVAGVANAAKGIENFDQLKLEQQVKVVTDALGTTADAGLLAMDVLGRGGSSLAKALGHVAAPVAVVGTVIDGIGAAKSFAQGHIATGSAQTAQTIGGALLAAAALSNAVPVAGQIAGVVLFTGGVVAQAIIGDEALDDDREDAQAFLEAGGFTAEQAEAYTRLEGDDRYNPGQFFQEVAEDQNVSVKELFSWMKTLSTDEATAFAVAGKRDYQDTQTHAIVDYLEKYGLVPGGIPDPGAVQKIIEEDDLFDADGAWDTTTLWAGDTTPVPDNVA